MGEKGNQEKRRLVKNDAQTIKGFKPCISEIVISFSELQILSLVKSAKFIV